MQAATRFERQIRLFGHDGQEKLGRAQVAVVGAGGLGSAVIQQLAHLGVGELRIIDHDIVEESNLNRLIGATPQDALEQAPKVAVMERMVTAIDPGIAVRIVREQLQTDAALAAIRECSHVLGCLDNDGARLILTELCSAYEIPYIDLASGVEGESPIAYGGRVFVSTDSTGCLSCYGELDPEEVRENLESLESRRNREAVYGVDAEALTDSGPSVLSINSVIASLAVTEFMVMVTGLREPSRLLTYRGHMGGRVAPSQDQPSTRDCYYCHEIRGKRDAAQIDRYAA